MPDSYADLPAVLKEQLTVVNDLIELGLAETSAFQIDDVPRISSIVKEQKDAVNRMWALEQRKAEIMNSIGPELPAEKLRQDFIFDNTLSCLVKQAKRLQEINETNRLLARMSLSYTRMMQKALGIVTGGYNAKGMPSAPPGSLGKLNASA